MIQRIQTLFLMLAFIASVLLFTRLPIAIFQLPEAGVSVPLNLISSYQNPETSQDTFTNINVIPLIILAAMVALLSIVPVFLYKNRPLQLRLTMFGFLTNVILIIVMFFTADEMQNLLKTQAKYKFGAILPIISLILIILASKAIRKDERLVKSADRLR